VTGCHTCGTKNPGTKGGDLFLDHRSPTAARANKPLFDGTLRTPRRKFDVVTVPDTVIMSRSAPEDTVRIRIWTDGYLDSDFVVIGIG
jgi:hypothetical protein